MFTLRVVLQLQVSFCKRVNRAQIRKYSPSEYSKHVCTHAALLPDECDNPSCNPDKSLDTTKSHRESTNLLQFHYFRHIFQDIIALTLNACRITSPSGFLSPQALSLILLDTKHLEEMRRKR